MSIESLYKKLESMSNQDFKKLLKEVEPFSRGGVTVEEYLSSTEMFFEDAFACDYNCIYEAPSSEGASFLSLAA